MTFVDITVVPVATEQRGAYVEFARRMAEVYRDHGATRIVDYWQAGPTATTADFHAAEASHSENDLLGLGEALGASPAESVAVTITEWPSREARDRGNAAAISDPRVTATLHEEPVFDGSRVIGESFEPTT